MFIQRYGYAYSSVITVNAPDRPAGISGLYIYPHNKNQIELRWSYAQNHIDSTVICRKLRNSVQDYQPISTIYNRGADYIFDSSIASGLKYIYKVNNYVSMQQSKSQYDMYYAPYRNCSEKSYIYINGAKYTVDTNLIESWLQGPPEFYVIAKSVNLGQTTVVDKSQRCLIAFGDRTSHQVAFNGNAIKQFYEWQTDDWKERLTFYAAEYDFLDFETTFRIKVGFNIMIADGISFSLGEASLDYNISSDTRDYSCGTAYLDYYELPDKWLKFLNYGFELQITD